MPCRKARVGREPSRTDETTHLRGARRTGWAPGARRVFERRAAEKRGAGRGSEGVGRRRALRQRVCVACVAFAREDDCDGGGVGLDDVVGVLDYGGDEQPAERSQPDDGPDGGREADEGARGGEGCPLEPKEDKEGLLTACGGDAWAALCLGARARPKGRGGRPAGCRRRRAARCAPTATPRSPSSSSRGRCSQSLIN